MRPPSLSPSPPLAAQFTSLQLTYPKICCNPRGGIAAECIVAAADAVVVARIRVRGICVSMAGYGHPPRWLAYRPGPAG